MALSPKLSYACEKLTSAVHAMAVSNSSLKERLKMAASECISLKPSDFPDENKDQWTDIIKSLTSKNEVIRGEGKLHRTLEEMSDDEASSLAEKIYNLYAQICELD